MNKTAKTVSALHGTAFTVFLIIYLVLQNFLFPLIDGSVGSKFWSVFIDAVVSAVLYSALYFVIYQIYKLFFFRILKKQPYIAGKWYHVHIKQDMNENFVHAESLRAGETIVKQTLFDITFEASNRNFSLENGQVVEDGDVLRITHWKHLACSWDGQEIIACYQAGSTHGETLSICPYCHTKLPAKIKLQGARKNRVGIHKFKYVRKTEEHGEFLDGTFADEYPSASYGKIFLFRDRAERDRLIADFLSDGTIDGFSYLSS